MMMSVSTLFQEMLVTGIWMTWAALVIGLGKICSLECKGDRIHPMVRGEKYEETSSYLQLCRNSDELCDEAWLEQGVTYMEDSTLSGVEEPELLLAGKFLMK